MSNVYLLYVCRILNESKVQKILGDKNLVENIKSNMKSSCKFSIMKEYKDYKMGKTRKDFFSTFSAVEEGFDILSRLAEKEEDIAGKILSFCSTATLHSMRLVSKRWAELVWTWFFAKEMQISKNWSDVIPNTKEFECQVRPSVIAVDDFIIVVGMENGKKKLPTLFKIPF